MRQALLIACCLLASCATYRAQPITPPQLARQFEKRSLANDGLRAYIARELGHDVQPWPSEHWNSEMLTLAAYYYSPALDIARAQWGTAKAGSEVARAIPNPIVQLPLQFTTPNPGPGSPFTAGLALDIPIEIAGKRGIRIDQASHLSEAARLAIGNEAWKVRGQVRDALLALYAARERSAFLSRRVDAQQQIIEMVEKRRSVGENSSPDVDVAVLISTQAQADLAVARSAEQNARAQLAAAIGVPGAALLGVQLDLDTFGKLPPALPAEDAQREAVLHRTDLLASLADYAAAESALQLEVAKQYPDIHLGPGYTYDTGTHKIAFGLAGISLPIFDQNQGGIARAEAQRKEAGARTAALQDTILGNLDHTVAQYQASLDAVRHKARQLTIARRQRESQSADFTVGNMDRLAYTQAKATYQVSEIAHLDAVLAAWKAVNFLEDALQRPLSQEAVATPLTEREIRQ